MTLRIGIVGLDNSHPFIDAHYLCQILGSVEFLVCDRRPERVQAFIEKFPTSRACPAESLFDLDALLVTLRPSRLASNVERIAASGLPTFVNKPGLTRLSHLFSLQAAMVAHPHHALMSASVLRFAPATRRTSVEWSDDLIVDVGHTIQHWRLAGNEWQANPKEGLGVVGAIGYHGLELLDAVVAGGLEGCSISDVRSAPVASGGFERASVELRGPQGRATMHISATRQGEHYAISRNRNRVPLLRLRGEDGHEGLGYAGAMRAFAAHISGDRSNGINSVLTSVGLACVAGEAWGSVLADRKAHGRSKETR